MKIIDEFTGRDDLSRSMKCVLRKKRDGRCRVSGCKGKVVNGALCQDHAIEAYKRHRKMHPELKKYRCKMARIIEEEFAADANVCD